MGAVAVGALLAALLLVIVAALVWQESRRIPMSEPAVYLIDEASRYVYDRLEEDTTRRLDLDDVFRILEWGIYWNQVEAPKAGGRRAVVGSGDSIEWIMERSEESMGTAYDPVDIAEVIARETEYLVEIGAVGSRAADAGEERS
ncbi:MAG: hypothetical protein R3290_12860 [Acidimicrobiia bacterium]|nr:hypothetical protein [Acidimicrobiia bacterium]